MVIDKLVEATMQKRNPCIVGIDPEWDKIPECYKEELKPEREQKKAFAQTAALKADAVWHWAEDMIDCVADVVPAIKPQMAFFEVYGAAGMEVFQKIAAYAQAHLNPNGPIHADFMTVSPFLGMDSIQSFADAAAEHGKGIFVLVKTSNPGSVQISEAENTGGEKIRNWLADQITAIGRACTGASGYSSIGAVVGATFPNEARELRKRMRYNYFLVPGFGAQGGSVEDIVACFNQDGLGSAVNSFRGILYKYLDVPGYDGTREGYLETVRAQTVKMQQEVYQALKKNCREMLY